MNNTLNGTENHEKIFKFLKLNSYLDLFNNIWIQYNLALDRPGAPWGHPQEFHNVSMLNIATSITCPIACSPTQFILTHALKGKIDSRKQVSFSRFLDQIIVGNK